MYKSILVPLDGSMRAEWALPAAIAIARMSGAQINLLTVEAPVPVLAAGMSLSEPVSDLKAGQSLPDYLNAVCGRVQAAGVKAATLGSVEPSALWMTSTGREIIDQAEEINADLIVMTTHARRALPRLFMGSVADDVVRWSRVPVMLVKPNADFPPEFAETPRFKHVLIPLDGSSFSEEVLPCAIAIGSLTGATFSLLRAIEPPRVYGVPVHPALLPVDEIALGELQTTASNYLNTVATRLRNLNLIAVTSLVVSQDPLDAILDYAHSCGVDLIAMTTHARNAAGRLLLGSLANQIVRRAEVPVLLQRPRGD